mgnify:FL=1
MIDTDFLELMHHLVDFQRMVKGSVSSGSYGHKTTSRDTVAETFEDVRSRMRTLTSLEMETVRQAGEVTSDFICYVSYDHLPPDLRQPKNVTIYQVVNVRSIEQGMAVVDAGPFDIQSVKLMGGENHHFQVRLLKVN